MSDQGRGRPAMSRQLREVSGEALQSRFGVGAFRSARPKDWRGPIAVWLLLGIVVLGLAAPLIAPYGPYDQDLFHALEGPSRQHWLGTDELGRDLLSRILHGVSRTILIPLTGVAIGASVGIVLGVISGYQGGLVDQLLMAVTDFVLTFPSMVLAVAIVAVMGVGERALVIAVAAGALPGPARVARGATMAVRNMEYFEACRALGTPDHRVLMRHVLPNVASPLIVQVTLELSQGVLLSAALGFLGLGVQPPAPEWGTMLSQARAFVALAPHMMLFPGLGIALLIFGLNLAGDALRDRLDPTASRGRKF